MNNNNSKQNNQQQNPYYNNTNKQAQGMNNMPSMNNLQGLANQNPYIKQKSFNTSEILTGALIGAAATYILTNENVQKTLFKGALSIGDIFSGGLDEIKERFEDAKAEREAQKEV